MNAVIGLLTAGALLVPGLGQAAPHHGMNMGTAAWESCRDT